VVPQTFDIDVQLQEIVTPISTVLRAVTKTTIHIW